MTCKMVLAFFVCLLFIQTWGQAVVMLERDVLRGYPAKDFNIFGQYLQEHVGQKISYSQDVRALELVELEVAPLKSKELIASSMSFERNTIFFGYPQYAFFVDVTYRYEYTLLLFPLTGWCKLRLYAVAALYSLSVVDNLYITPKFTAQWGVQSLNFSNPLAQLLGVIDFMVPTALNAIGPHYQRIVNNVMATRVKTFYASYYADRTNYLEYPFIHGSTIRILNKFKGLQLTSDALIIGYSQGPMQPYQSIMGSGEMLRGILMDYNAIGAILTKALSITKNVLVRPENIPPIAKFQLDIPGLLHIFPELLLEYGTHHTVFAELNGWDDKLNFAFNIDNNEVTYSPFNLTLNLYVDNDTLKVLSTTFQLRLTFVPFVTCDAADPSVALLHLRLVKHDVTVQSWEAQISPEGLFNPAGIADYIRAALENWVLKYHELAAFGKGLKISSGFFFALDQTLARVTVNGIVVLLYSP